ncbi:ArsR/SmtB family transcription factor [Streptomyces cinerochromogenes]|uniref:ArsR/SmtB family transcription factor n=1 Tax=Streptomyces cinerochromogenes TaxID=66422 RepID=UPI0033AF0364
MPGEAQVLADLGQCHDHDVGGSVLELLGITAKSTMTHHWRVLRESGVIWQHPSGRENLLSLRREDLDARYPGLLDAVLAGAADDEALENAPGTAIR